MISVFFSQQPLWKRQPSAKTRCETRIYVSTKTPTLTARKEEGDKSGLCVARGGKYFLSTAIKSFSFGLCYQWAKQVPLRIAELVRQNQEHGDSQKTVFNM